jgi:hypothetical protein
MKTPKPARQADGVMMQHGAGAPWFSLALFAMRMDIVEMTDVVAFPLS